MPSHLVVFLLKGIGCEPIITFSCTLSFQCLWFLEKSMDSVLAASKRTPFSCPQPMALFELGPDLCHQPAVCDPGDIIYEGQAA